MARMRTHTHLLQCVELLLHSTAAENLEGVFKTKQSVADIVLAHRARSWALWNDSEQQQQGMDTDLEKSMK